MIQRNKYLDDLGIPVKKYGVNFMDGDPREESMREEEKIYGFSAPECWNLDQTFIEWLYSHLMKYKEDASKVINLKAHTVEFKGKTYTQIDAIDYILKNLTIYLKKEVFYEGDKEEENVRDAVKMWREIMFYCWW